MQVPGRQAGRGSVRAGRSSSRRGHRGSYLHSSRIRSLEIDLDTVDATVYGRDLDSDPRLYLAAVTVMAEVIFDGSTEAAGNLEQSPQPRQWRYVASLLVDFHFNARITDDGSVASFGA